MCPQRGLGGPGRGAGTVPGRQSDSVLTQPIAKYKAPVAAVNRVLSYLGLDVVGTRVSCTNLPKFLTSFGDIRVGRHKLYTLGSESITTWWRTNHRLHGGYLHCAHVARVGVFRIRPTRAPGRSPGTGGTRKGTRQPHR